MKRSIRCIFLILILIVAICCRVYCVSQKKLLFADTPSTFILSSPTFSTGQLFVESWKNFNFELNKEYTAKELKQLMFANDGTVKSLVNDLKDLYLNHRDPSHSNFYFMLVRIWDFNLQDISVQTLIWYGFTLNLFIFIITFFVLYKFLQYLIGDEKYVLATLFIYSICTNSISATILIREYQLQTLGFLLVSFVFAYVYRWIEKHKNLEVFTLKNIIIASFAFAFFSLTGYYSLLYSFGLILTLIFVVYKNLGLSKKIFKSLGLIFILTLMFTLIGDPCFFDGFNPDYLKFKIDTNQQLIQGPFFEQIVFLIEAFCGTVYYLVAVVFFFVLLFCAKKKKIYNPLINVLFFNTLIWSLFVVFFAPYSDIRYMIPATPVLIMQMVYLFRMFNFRYTFILCLMYFLGYFYSIVDINPLLKYEKPLISYVYNYDLRLGNYIMNKSVEPFVIKKYQFSLGHLVLHAKDEQKFMFVDEIPDKNFKYKKFFFFDGVEYEEVDVYKIRSKGNNVIGSSCIAFGECFAVINNDVD